MNAVIGTALADLTISVTVRPGKPIVIGMGQIEVQVVGSYALVTATTDTGTTTGTVDTADTRTELANALRQIADQLDAINVD
jgi:hypothetical protein